MRRGSTPVIILNVTFPLDDNGDPVNILSGCDIYVTIDQDGLQVTKDTVDNDGSLILVPVYDDENVQTGLKIQVNLSQSDTLKFDIGTARVQTRWIEADGTAHVSDISKAKFTEVLLEEVISHG